MLFFHDTLIHSIQVLEEAFTEINNLAVPVAAAHQIMLCSVLNFPVFPVFLK